LVVVAPPSVPIQTSRVPLIAPPARDYSKSEGPSRLARRGTIPGWTGQTGETSAGDQSIR
jgi:hypothetical protein